jgi:hypothetical protein
MSGLGVEHVREMPLESGLEDIYVWLTRKKAKRPDMFGQSLWNTARGPNMSGMTGVFGDRIDF